MIHFHELIRRVHAPEMSPPGDLLQTLAPLR